MSLCWQLSCGAGALARSPTSWLGLLKFLPNPKSASQSRTRAPGAVQGGPHHTAHDHESTINWPFIFLCPIRRRPNTETEKFRLDPPRIQGSFRSMWKASSLNP